MQRAMNRAALSDVQQRGALLVGQLAVELQFALDAVHPAGFRFTVGAVLGVDAPVAQSHCDGGARAQCGQQQVVWAGAGTSAADLGGLVGEQFVAADGDALTVRTRIGLGDDHHAT